MLNHPTLRWEEGVPVSEQFGDVYYSRDSGLAEARHVFLDGNGLPMRWRHHAAQQFVIAETGFGTGLNFLAAWQAWDQLPQPRPRLHFISVEQHPLAVEDMARAHSLWPELAPYSEALCAVYPHAYPGVHRRHLAGGNVILDLCWGDALDMLAKYDQSFAQTQVDAWFLDGFAPAKNEGMWQPELYRIMRSMSAGGTTVASFTAAGHVRRGLEAEGFAMRRVAGFGRKREMLAGALRGQVSPMQSKRPAIVIGGGIAGAGAAWQLAQQGKNVVVIEADNLASGASAAPLSIMSPYYTLDWSQRGRLYASGFAYTQHVWTYLERKGHTIDGRICGVLSLDIDEAARTKHDQWAARLKLPREVLRRVDAVEASALAGVDVPFGGVWFSEGGFISLSSLVQALLADAGERVELRQGYAAEHMQYHSGIWRVTLANGDVLESDLVVMASGMGAKRFLPDLPLRPVRGQLLSFAAPEHLSPLKCVLKFGRTLTPAYHGRMVLGSTFAPNRDDIFASDNDTEILLRDLAALFPDTGSAELVAVVTPWCGIRCTTAQRQPIVGSVTDKSGLYLHLSHGSRGSLSGLQPFVTAAY